MGPQVKPTKSGSSLLLFVLCLLVVSGKAQNTLVLQHTTKPQIIRSLPEGIQYKIVTLDQSKYFSPILKHTDSSVFVRKVSEVLVEPMDTSIASANKHTANRTEWKEEIVEVPFSKIKYIYRDWYPHNNWIVPFVYAEIFAGINILFLPVAAIDSGKEGVKNWAIFEGVLLALSTPAFIGTRSTRYDVQKKWSLKVNSP